MSEAEATGVQLGSIVESTVGGVWGDDHARPGLIQVRCLRGIDLNSLAEGAQPDPPLRWVSSSQLESRRLTVGDLVIEASGSNCGRSIVIRGRHLAAFAEPLVYSNFCRRLVVTDSAYLSEFVGWCVRTAFSTGEIASFRTGTSIPNLAVDSLLERFELPSVPLEQQRFIASTLGTLDDKIELNRRMNETLEEMARALFMSWFVDFDPVRAKAGGRDPGLPTHLADVFPDRLVESESGEIPEGWEVRPLGDLLQVLETGGRPKGGVALYDSGVPSIGAESIVGLGIHDFSKTKYVPREYFDAMRRGHIQDGDVLLYKDGGKPGQFEPHVTLVGDAFPFGECAINEHVYRVRADSALGQAYLYFWLSSEAAEAEMRNRGTGVAIPGLNSTQVKSLTTLVPTEPVLAHFARACGPLISRILANCNEARALAAIRDALLPRLISGEISSSALGRREAASTASGP